MAVKPKAPVKAAISKPVGGVSLRQKALELAVTTSAVDVHHNYNSGGVSGYGGPPTTTRRYASEADILKTAAAFLKFMAGKP